MSGAGRGSAFLAAVAAVLVMAGCAGSGASEGAGSSPPGVAPASSGERLGGRSSDGSGADVHAQIRTAWPGARIESGAVAVVAGTVSDSTLTRVAQAADDAWTRCGRAWPEPLPPPVIYVPGDAAEASALGQGRIPPPRRQGVGVSPPISPPRSDVPTTAPASAPVHPSPDTVDPAATTIVVGRPPKARVRIHLSPRWDDLSDEGQRVVLTHECVHVALARQVRPPAPRWLVEGVAEHVAYRGSTVSADEVVAPLLQQVARTGPPAALPTDVEFDVAASGVARPADELLTVYAEAHTAAAAYADAHGEDGLIRLLVQGAVSAGPGSTSYADVAADLTPVWQAHLRDRATRHTGHP